MDGNHLAILRTEITNDPLTRGYSGMTDAQVATNLNTANRTKVRDRIDSAELYEALDAAEYQALSAALKSELGVFLGMGYIFSGANSRARTRIIAMFGGGSTTITNLGAIVNSTVTRAAELGLPNVGAHHVAIARAA